MTIPDIIYAYHEDIITRSEARWLIDALAHMELSVHLKPGADDVHDAEYAAAIARSAIEWHETATR